MRLPAKLSCALLACMCAICGLSAQTPEGPSGRVVDENGEAVAGAYLIAVDPGTSEVLAATASDAEGEYTLPTLSGDFILNVSCIGYESLDIPVEGGTQGLEAVGTIRMQSVATRIDEAVVTADAPKIERELGRFVMRDVSASPLAKGSSTYNFLKFMPMVNIRPEGGVTVLNRDANIRINGRGIGGMAEQMIKGIPADEIERCVTALRGLDIFSKVEYRLTNSAPYDLVFLLEADGNWQLNVGARFDTRDIASILVNVTSGKRLTSSNHLSLTGRISKNAYLQADYSYGSLLGSKLGASYQLKYNDFDLYSNKKRVESMTFLSHRLSLFYTATLFNFSARAGARVDYFDYHHSLYDVNYTPLRRSSDFFLNYFVDFTLDTYDSKYFPTKGARTYISGTVHTDNGVSYDGNEPFVDAAFHFSTVCRLSDRFCLQPALKGRFVFGDNIPSIYQNYVGGNFDACYMAQQVAWESVQHVHIVDHDFMAAKLALRYRLKERIYLSALAEYGKESHHLKSIFAGNDLWGVALQAAYDFMLGPVALQVNYSNLYKNVGVYASAGFWF